MSQEALAHEIGFDRTYVGGVERGERNLSLRSVERLAALFEVPTMFLLTVDLVWPTELAAVAGEHEDPPPHRLSAPPEPRQD